MFDLCPPFQIDGNLGGPAAMTEMLIQSIPGEISLLPALPKRWPNGSVKGVRVRGGAKVDITWKGGRLAECKLQSDHAAKYRLTYGGHVADVQLRGGTPVLIDSSLQQENKLYGERNQ
jgi:alpha-L-fucosidase 2